MPAIQLAGGDKVERRDQEARPTGKSDRMKKDIHPLRWQHAAKDQVFDRQI